VEEHSLGFAMNRLMSSDLFLLPILLTLGVLSFGWIFSQELGVFITLLTSCGGLLMMGIAITYRIRLRLESAKNRDTEGQHGSTK
jgi:hypothetical protein